MQELSTAESRQPNGILLGLAAFATTGIGIVAWLLIVLGAVLDRGWSEGWIYAGCLLPGAAFGAVLTHETGRRAPLCIGLLATLVPLLLFLVLQAEAPPRPPAGFD